MPRRCVRTSLATLTVAVLAAGMTIAGAVTAPSALAATNQFRGVNWADPRDNYADDPVVPSGLSTSDSYATVYAKAGAVIGGFAANLGANTVRLPVNPYSVNGPFWAAPAGSATCATASARAPPGRWWTSGARR